MSIALQAVYKSHRTTADGGFALTLDLGEHMADELNEVFRMRDQSLFVVCMTEAEYYANQDKKQVKNR